MQDCHPLAAVYEEQQRQFATDRALRLRIARCNWGYSGGWFVEYRGEPVAVLSDARGEEMFWVSYRITPLSDDPTVHALLDSPEFWWNKDVQFRHREIGLVASLAFGAGVGPLSGRIEMRGLYFNLELTLLDRAVLLLERLFRKRRVT